MHHLSPHRIPLLEGTKKTVTRMGIEFILLAVEDMAPLGLLTSTVWGMDGRRQNFNAGVCIMYYYYIQMLHLMEASYLYIV